jgi:hypothetical protein
LTTKEIPLKHGILDFAGDTLEHGILGHAGDTLKHGILDSAGDTLEHGILDHTGDTLEQEIDAALGDLMFKEDINPINEFNDYGPLLDWPNEVIQLVAPPEAAYASLEQGEQVLNG